MRIRIIFLIFILFLTGCQTIWPTKETEITKPLDFSLPIKRPELSKPVKFKLKLPHAVYNVPKKILDKKVSITAMNTPLSVICGLLQQQLGVPVISLIGDEAKGKLKDPKLTLRYSGKASTLFNIISELNDVWVYCSNGIIKIDDEYSLSFIIPTLLQTYSGSFSTKNVKVSAENKDLKEMIENAAKELNLEVLMISTASGYVQVSGRPKEMKKFVQFLNDEVLEVSKFVAINVHIIQLTLNRNLEKSFSFSYLLDMLNKTQGIVQLPSGSMSENKPTTILEISTQNKLKNVFQYINSFGKTEIVSSPTLVTANGIPAVLNLKKEIGWWLPGDIEDVTVGDNTGRVRQGRPQWESEDVGLTLLIRPRIVSDKKVHLDIYFSNSEVYNFVEFEWQADPNLEPVTLSKPVVAETELLTRASIKEGQYLMIAGIRKDQEVKSESFPANLNKSRKIEKSYLFIIISIAM